MRIILLLISALSFSCSSFTVTRVTEDNRQSVKGLRFFLPKPYLLIAEKDLLVDGVKTVEKSKEKTTTTTQKMAVARKELQCSVIYLPDPQKEYAISTLASKTSAKIKLVDGWRLTGFNLAIPNEIPNKQLGLLSGTADLKPGLYAIEYQNNTPTLKKVKIHQ